MGLERSVRKQIGAIQVCVAFLAIAVIVLTATAFHGSEQHGQVLRVRGLVIEDDQGR
jgi:hypothetical protein